MSPRDEAALSLYQSTKGQDRAVAESLLDQFFNFSSQDEFEEQLRAVTREMDR